MTTQSEKVAHASLVGGGVNVLHSHPYISSFAVENPVATDDAILQHKFAAAVTILRVSASTDVGTVTFQFEERGETTPNSTGTNVMTSSLVADNNTEITTSFANAAIAVNAVFSLNITAVSASPGVVRIHVEYKMQ